MSQVEMSAAKVKRSQTEREPEVETIISVRESPAASPRVMSPPLRPLDPRASGTGSSPTSGPGRRTRRARLCFNRCTASGPPRLHAAPAAVTSPLFVGVKLLPFLKSLAEQTQLLRDRQSNLRQSAVRLSILPGNQ